MSRAAWIDIGLIVSLTLLWGSAFALIVVALPVFSPAMIAFLRVAIAGVFIAGYAVVAGAGLPKTRDHWLRCAALGFFGFALPFTLVPLGQEYVNSATAAILMAFSPISTLILAHFFTDDEKLTGRRILGVFLGFAGVLVLFGGASDLEATGFGTAALLGAAFGYAVAGIISKGMRDYSDVTSSAGALVMATAWCVPGLAWRGDFSKLGSVPDAGMPALASILALAIGTTGLATLFMLALVRRRGATFTATSNYGVPVVGVLLGALALSEPLRWNILVTLALIIAAIWLTRPPVKSG